MTETPTAAPDLTDLLADAPSNWGKWGPDDEVGSLNYLGPEQVLLTANGPVVVGWQNAYIGRPETDVETTLARIQELRPPDNARLWTLANVGWKRFDSAYRSVVTDVTRPVSGRSSHHRRRRSSRS